METRHFISFREHDVGGSFRLYPLIVPTSALDGPSNLLLLIHGFNNNEYEASESYRKFVATQADLAQRPLPANIVEIYWPGDTSVPRYHLSIPRAQNTARQLAAVLEVAADRRGPLVVDVVAHSMGCRLTLELIDILHGGQQKVTVRRVAFLAAAVPIRQLEHKRPLRTAFERARTRALSLFSPIDEALGAAFRIGQLRANIAKVDDSGVLPVALGAAEWRPIPFCPEMEQHQAINALHGDYWTNRRGDVAPRVQNHLGLSPTRHIVPPVDRQRFVLARKMAGGVIRKLRSRQLPGD